jgi:hypothetical protein
MKMAANEAGIGMWVGNLDKVEFVDECVIGTRTIEAP